MIFSDFLFEKSCRAGSVRFLILSCAVVVVPLGPSTVFFAVALEVSEKQYGSA